MEIEENSGTEADAGDLGAERGVIFVRSDALAREVFVYDAIFRKPVEAGVELDAAG